MKKKEFEAAKGSEGDIKKALGSLSSVGQYASFMETLPNGFDSKKFRDWYEEFYKLKRYPEKFRDEYFIYMQKNRDNSSLTFEEVLKELESFQRTVEASFASKLLHTIRPNDFPTWDHWIGEYTDIRIPTSSVKDQFTRAVEKYAELTAWFKGHIQSKDGKAMLKLFDQYYPCFKLSAIKKIDLILWQLGRITPNGK